MSNPIVHFEIEAQDIERAKKFYADALGWEMEQMGKEYGEYVVVKTKEEKDPMGINGGIYAAQGKKQINAYSCVVSVQNIHQAIKAVKSAGGKVLDEKPMDIPNVGLYVKCQDTEGNHFTILQPAPEMKPKT